MIAKSSCYNFHYSRDETLRGDFDVRIYLRSEFEGVDRVIAVRGGVWGCASKHQPLTRLSKEGGKRKAETYVLAEK